MNKYQDNKINYDPSQGKMIAEIICKEIEESMSKNSGVYNRAKRNERLYAQVTNYMAEGKVCDQPWDGAADYFIPLTEWIVDAVWGRVLKVLFYKRPYMTAKGTEASDTEKEGGVTDFVDQVNSEIINLYDNFKFYVKQMIKLPFAVLKYCWVHEYDRVYEKAKATVFMSPDGTMQEQILPEEQDKAMQLVASGFIPGGEQEVIVLNEREIYNAPKLQYIKFEDYVWAPNSKKGLKPYWEGDRFWLTISEMQNNIEFNPEVVEKLKRNIQINGASPSQQVIANRSTLFECFHWYGRLPVNKQLMIDFQAEDAVEHEVHAIVTYKDKELLMVNQWEYKRDPRLERVYIRSGFEETEGFTFRSLVDKLYMTQKELNTLHNNIMNNAVLAMMKVFTKRRTLVGDEYSRPKLKPGIFLDVDLPTDIGVLEVGDVKNISFELESTFINFAERLSNISVYQTGTARSTGGAKTKGEVDRTVYEGNIGIDKFIENCFASMKKIAQWTVDYYYHNIPVGLERRIRGENSEMIFPTQQNMSVFDNKGILPYWQEDDLAGKFDFIWENTSLNTSEAYQIQLANDLQDRYLAHPMVAQNLMATWHVLKMGLEARKVKNWQDILPPKEAIEAEMKRMQAEAEARTKVERSEGQVKQKAFKRAVMKGVPPEKAAQLLNQAMQGGGGGQGGANAQV